MKKILKNLACGICIIIYFLILALAYTRMHIDRLSQDIKVFSGMFLVLGLLFLEKAYKNDEGKTAITAIELLVLSFHSLSIVHIITLIKCEFTTYMFVSCSVVGIYYVLKSIVIYTKKKREDLKNLSDISEILKKDEPVKKEAKKRNLEEIETKNIKVKDSNKKVEKNKVLKKQNKKSTEKKSQEKKAKTKKKTTKKEVKEND